MAGRNNQELYKGLSICRYILSFVPKPLNLNMKKTILTLGVFLCGISIASAQTDNTPPPIQAAQTTAASSRLESIRKTCNLTPDQTTKVQNLLNDFEASKADNEKANKGNPAATQEANKKSTYDFNQKLAKVLTPEQMKSLNASDAAWAKEHAAKAK
jgi:Spy/CpxP family protein refolding chaperone